MQSLKRPFESEDVDDHAEFDNSIPRSGKWTPEEESFAFKLIRDFESGNLLDCDEGCTLRSYLARKLNCAPMRISKKFAGKCIGKHTFSRKSGALLDGACQSTWLGSDSIFPKRKLQRLNIAIRHAESPQPFRESFCDEDSPRASEFMSGTTETPMSDGWVDSKAVRRMAKTNLPFSESSSSLDQIVGVDTDWSGESNYLSDTDSLPSEEAEEWRDVLSYFCGSLVDCDESGSSSKLIPRNISYTSLFRE